MELRPIINKSVLASHFLRHMNRIWAIDDVKSTGTNAYTNDKVKVQNYCRQCPSLWDGLTGLAMLAIEEIINSILVDKVASDRQTLNYFINKISPAIAGDLVDNN